MANLTSTIKLGLDSSEVKRGIAKTKDGFRQMGKQVKLAFAAAGAAAVGYFNKFRQEMDRISKLATQLDATTDAIQRVGLAAQLAGSDLETAANGIKRMIRGLVEAERGSKTYEQALSALGLKAEELLNMGMEEQLLELSRAYVAAGAGGRELAAVQELMGRQGAELIPLLQQGPDALREAMQDAKVVSGETIAEMVRLNDELTKAENAWKAGFGKAVVYVTRVIKSMQLQMQTYFSIIAVGIQGAIEQFSLLGDLMKKVMQGDVQGAGSVADKMRDSLRDTGDRMGEVWKDDGKSQRAIWYPQEAASDAAGQRVKAIEAERMDYLNSMDKAGTKGFEEQLLVLKQIEERLATAERAAWESQRRGY